MVDSDGKRSSLSMLVQIVASLLQDSIMYVFLVVMARLMVSTMIQTAGT